MTAASTATGSLTSFDRVCEWVRAAGGRVRMAGPHQADAQCPMPDHDDRHESLSITYEPENGRTQVLCHTPTCGARGVEIADALGHPRSDLYDNPWPKGQKRTGGQASPPRQPRRKPAPARPAKPAGPVCLGQYDKHREPRITREPVNRPDQQWHAYHDEQGTEVAWRIRVRCTRCGEKVRMAWRYPDQDGKPSYGQSAPAPAEMPLYGLPAIREAIREGRPIYLTEGETDADAVTALGVVAGTHGAADNGTGNHWRPWHAESLRGAREVNLIQDRDDAGRTSAQYIARQLLAAGIPTVRILEPTQGKDVRDHIETGHSLDELVPVPIDDDHQDHEDHEDHEDDDAEQTIDLRDSEDAASTGNVHTLPGVDPKKVKLPPGANPETWVAHGSYGTDGRQTWERKGGEWVKLADVSVRFLAARTTAPDPDFPDRAEDGDDQDLEARTDVEITTEDGGRIRRKIYRGVRTSQLRKLVPLDHYGPRAWRGADSSPAGVQRLFRAVNTLSDGQGIAAVDFYAVTGWHPAPDGHGEMFVHGCGAIGPAGVVPDVDVRIGDHIGAFLLGEPAFGRDLIDGFVAVAELVECGAIPGRLLWPTVGTALRPLFGQYRAPVGDDDVSATVAGWFTGGTTAGKSGTMAAGLNVAYPRLRYNTFPIKAGSHKHGGTSGAALDRVLFRGRDLLIPFDDCDPSEPEASRAAWQSDFLRRASGQYGRVLATREGGGTRGAMPCRCSVMATGEPLDAEASAENRAVNLPMEQGDVRLSVLAARTGLDERALRGRVGAGLVAILASDREQYRRRLEAARRGILPMFVSGDVPGPVRRAGDVFAELAATLRVLLSVMVDQGMSRHDARRYWRALCDALRAAWRAHLVVIGTGDRGARALSYLRTALESGAMRLDDKANGQGAPSRDQFGWERRPADANYADGQLRPMSLVVGGYQDAETGDLLLLPATTAKVVKTLAEGAGDSWTGGTKTLGSALKSGGYLAIADGRGKRDEATARPRIAGKQESAWCIPLDRFTREGAGQDYTSRDYSGPVDTTGMPLPWLADEPERRGEGGSEGGLREAATCGEGGSEGGAKPPATCDEGGEGGKSAPSRIGTGEGGSCPACGGPVEDGREPGTECLPCIDRRTGRQLTLDTAGSSPDTAGPSLDDDGLPATCPGCGQPVKHGREDFEGWHVGHAPADVRDRGVARRKARDAATAPAAAPGSDGTTQRPQSRESSTQGRQERRAVDRTAVLVLGDDGAALVVAETAGTRYPIPTPARVGDLAREAAALDLTRVWIPSDTLTGLGLADLPKPRRAEDVTGTDHPWSEPAPGVEQHGPRGLGSWMKFTVPEVRKWPVYVAIPAWMGSRHPLRELDAADVAETLRLFAATVGAPLSLEVWTARNILAKEAGARSTDGAQRSHKRSLAPCAAILTGQVPRATHVREDGTVTAGAGFTMVPPRWERALTDDERAATHVHKYDGNAAYLASYGATPLGLGEPEHRDGPVAFDRKRAGYWRVDELPAHGIDGMPPFRVKTVRDGQTWLTTPEADLLARLGILPAIREAVVWPESSRRLDTMSRRLREARRELRKTRGTPAGDAAWSLAGFMHQAPAQYLARNGAAPNPAQDRTNAALFRPDWRDQIISHVRASHWWRLYRAQQESGRAPVFVNEDAAAYAADAADPAAAVPRGLVLGTDGGQYKPEGHVPMNAFLKYRKRPDAGFMTAFDRAKGGE